MFKNCYSLISLDLSNFDIYNLEEMEGIFSGCLKLTSINLSGFKKNKISVLYNMF